MPSDKRKFGDIGEKIAARWLENRGFNILDKNYLKKWGEIDIVAKSGGVLRFIEVKTVKRDLLFYNKKGVIGIRGEEYRPEENVHPKKLERLHRVIQSYLMEKEALKPDASGATGEWQLDIVAVYLDEPHKLAKVEMMENIVG